MYVIFVFVYRTFFFSLTLKMFVTCITSKSSHPHCPFSWILGDASNILCWDYQNLAIHTVLAIVCYSCNFTPIFSYLDIIHVHYMHYFEVFTLSLSFSMTLGKKPAIFQAVITRILTSILCSTCHSWICVPILLQPYIQGWWYLSSKQINTRKS